jgi:hypothetical protein
MMVSVSMTGIDAGVLCQASIVENNFATIENALSSNLDSNNYANSSVYSHNIKASEIKSQHVSTSQVLSAHLSSQAILEANVDYASGGGVRVIRIGAAASNMPDNGVGIARLTASRTIGSRAASTNAYFFQALWFNADAIDGEPQFIGTPTLGEPGVYIDTATYSHSDVIGSDWCGPDKIDLVSADNARVSVRLNYDRSIASDATHVVTVQVCVEGPV